MDHKQLISIFFIIRVQLSSADYRKSSPSDLWQEHDAITTDAATKNLPIENSIVSELNSQYKSIHLLCKSHTVWMFSLKYRSK